MSSSKKSKKQKTKSKLKATTTNTSKKKKKKTKKTKPLSPKNNTAHLKVSLGPKSLSNADDIDHKRSKSPLSPFTGWYKSHKKSSKSKRKYQRQRSQSNKFYTTQTSSKYQVKNDKSPKPNTPRNTESKYKKKRTKNTSSSPETDPKKQLKFTQKNNKITVTVDSPSTSTNRKTKNKIKTPTSTHTVSISQLSKSTNSSPSTSTTNKKTSKKKRQSFAKRATLQFKKKPRSRSANPPNAPNASHRKKSSFFTRSRDKKKKHKKNKSFKERISRKSKTKKELNETVHVTTYSPTDGHNILNVDSFNRAQSHHEQQSSLNVHKLRMTAKALREEMDDDAYDIDNMDMISMHGIKLLERDDSSSLSSHSKYTTTIKFKDNKNGTNRRGHHKRGSSGIPHFYQKKLAFDLGLYLDEKARLFVSHFCRLYALRITETLFAIISDYHVMPFDCGFICITSKDDDKFACLQSVTYHNPLIQMPMTSMSRLLGVADAITDDRLSALLEQDREIKEIYKQQSVPLRGKSVPPPPKTQIRNTSKSFDHINKKPKMKDFIVKAPVTKVSNTSSTDSIVLTQSQSLHAYSADEECSVDDMDKKKEQDLMKIKKYKKKATKKRRKNIGKKLLRSTTFDSDKKQKRNKKSKKRKTAPRIFYGSASELSEDEATSFEETDLSAEADDGFPAINYTELLHENSFPHNAMKLQEETLSEHSISMELSHKLFTKTTPTLYEDTQTTFNSTPNTITNNKTSELFTDYSPPPSPRGYRSEDNMTPNMTPCSPTITASDFNQEFKISFDVSDMQIISNQNKINKMQKEWIGVSENVNGIGIAEWTILTNPKVFNYHNDPKNKQTVNSIAQRVGIGLGGLGFGIGGFIDRTRGVCGVSLAPIYYRYGGMDTKERYYDKLDIYNLYTGDYRPQITTLPFNNLYATASSVVREGYKSTLVITGGQYYGQEIFDDSFVQSKTYFYAPWINSNYHHQISEYGLNHGIMSTNNNNPSRNQSRRNSITDISSPIGIPTLNSGTPTNPTLNNTINFSNIVTRPKSTSISVTRSYRPRRDKNSPTKTNETSKRIAATISELAAYTDKASKMDKKIGDGNWLLGPSMITSRASHGSVSWDEHIIFCCGGIGSAGRRISNVEMLRMDKFKQLSDVSKLRWRKCTSMSANKSNLVLIHWKPKTCIVSVGSGSKVVESYDPYKDMWKDLPPLNTHQVSSKSCRFYYDAQSNRNCLIFIKFRNGVIKSMEYLDERKKLKKWTVIKDQYVELFNAQINSSNSSNSCSNSYLKNMKTFSFS